MSFTVVADQDLESSFEALRALGTGAFEHGLLIGQYNVSHNTVVITRKLPTPQRDDEEDKSSSSSETEWVGHHAEQVARGLPGGLQVVGVYLYAPGRRASKAMVVDMACAVHAISKTWNLIDLVLFVGLQRTSMEEPLKAVQFEYNQMANALARTTKPAVLKYSNQVESGFSVINFRVPISVGIAVETFGNESIVSISGNSIQERAKRVETALQTYVSKLAKVSDEMILIDPISNDPIGNASVLQPGSEVDVKLAFHSPHALQTVVVAESEKDCNRLCNLTGDLGCMAYTYGVSSNDEIKSRVLEDVRRTIMARARIVGDEAIDIVEQLKDEMESPLKKSELDEPIVRGLSIGKLALPTRVFFPLGLQTSRIFGCDYISDGEALDDVRGRIEEIFSFAVEEKSIRAIEEKVDFLLPTETSRKIQTQCSSEENTRNVGKDKSRNLLIMSVVVGLMAVLVALAYLVMSKLS